MNSLTCSTDILYFDIRSDVYRRSFEKEDELDFLIYKQIDSVNYTFDT